MTIVSVYPGIVEYFSPGVLQSFVPFYQRNFYPHTHMHPIVHYDVGYPSVTVPSVEIIRPVTPPLAAPIRVPPPGMCFYHSTLPAKYICSRCGRQIGRECANYYGDLIICPQCYPAMSPFRK